MVIEEAKKELEKLETRYPNKFQSLKHDLRIFISEMEDQSYHSQNYPSSSVSTKASSTRRKKRKNCEFDVKQKGDINDIYEAETETEVEGVRKCNINKRCCDDSFAKSREMSTDAVIERARVCLHKVQLFKTTFFSY